MNPLAFFNSAQDMIIILITLGCPCLFIGAVIFLVVKLAARKPPQ